MTIRHGSYKILVDVILDSGCIQTERANFRLFLIQETYTKNEPYRRDNFRLIAKIQRSGENEWAERQMIYSFDQENEARANFEKQIASVVRK